MTSSPRSWDEIPLPRFTPLGRRISLFQYDRKVKTRVLRSFFRRCEWHKIYVGNLGYDVDSKELEKLFLNHGAVESASVITDRGTGQSKGFGFVEMGSKEAAQAAISALNGTEHGGRALNVNLARPREERGGGGGGRGWNRL
jgi:RNA recognition motif-containing protein